MMCTRRVLYKVSVNEFQPIFLREELPRPDVLDELESILITEIMP